MDFIEQRPQTVSKTFDFHADVSTTNNPQNAISVKIGGAYMSNITTLSSEGLTFEANSAINVWGYKVLMCIFHDYRDTATISVSCNNDVDNVTLIELALDYIGAGNLKYVVSERYIEVI